MLKIPEKHTVYHQYRIFCLTDLLLLTLPISPVTHPFHFDLLINGFDNNMKHDQMKDWDPPTHDSKNSPADAELFRCKINRNNTDPKNKSLNKNTNT